MRQDERSYCSKSNVNNTQHSWYVVVVKMQSWQFTWNYKDQVLLKQSPSWEHTGWLDVTLSSKRFTLQVVVVCFRIYPGCKHSRFLSTYSWWTYHSTFCPWNRYSQRWPTPELIGCPSHYVSARSEPVTSVCCLCNIRSSLRWHDSRTSCSKLPKSINNCEDINQ